MTALRDLHGQARREKAAIAALEARGATPIALPTPPEVAARPLNLKRLVLARLDVSVDYAEIERRFSGGVGTAVVASPRGKSAARWRQQDGELLGGGASEVG